MDLNSVNIFVLVVQAGSFSAAARKSGIPLATVSRRVSDLEQTVGARLLQRSTRHLRLTEAGKTFFTTAQQGIRTLESARLALQERENSPTGTIRLSIPPNFDPIWQIAQAFQALHTKVRIEVFVTERKIDLIEDDIDIVVRVGEPVHQSMVTRNLMPCQHMLVASPSFKERYGLPQHPSALADLPCAAWNMRQAKTVWTLGDEDWEVQPQFMINDFAPLKQLALKGQAVVEMPDFLLGSELRQGSLLPVLEDYPLPLQQVSVLYPSRKQLPRMVHCFIEYCIEQIAQYDSPGFADRPRPNDALA